MIGNERAVREWVASWIARTMGTDRCAVNTLRPFDEHGLSSRDIVAMSGELSAEFGVTVPPDAVFEFPTTAALAAHTAALAGAAATPARGPAPDRGLAERDDVAVVGIGCRLPGGVRGPRALWRTLIRGESGITSVPADRWSAPADGDPAITTLLGRPAVARGGFLADIGAFDARFFEISAREAELMDPQQRLALEVAWEALDDAGISPRTLAGTRTGVFAGVAAVDYVPDGLDGFDGWGATGSSMGVVASRISYALDVRGPSMVVDTACSASLVAVHLAKESLSRGESDLALAGGVNLILSPAVSIAFAAAGVLAPDARCKTFDAEADGYVRSEGCGFVVLQRLTDARRDGNRVLAVIAGSATNSNGRSNGLMAPHPGAQEDLLRHAYRDAGVHPSEVQFVEVHGTGTALGDAVEVAALAAVATPGRPPGRELVLGAVKTNLGHLEAAAGIAGFIKTVLALRRGTIPPTVGPKRINPALGLDDLPIRVVTEPVAWPAEPGRRIGGVSSFGFGGANAHVVLRDPPVEAPALPPAPPPATVDDPTRGPVVLVVSASSEASLRAEATSLRRWLEGPGATASLGAVATGLAKRRSAGGVRAAAVVADPVQAMAGLDAVAAGADHPTVCRGSVRDRCEPVFVFSGHGSQSPGMAALMLDTDEAFAAAVDELEPLVAAEAGFSLRAELSAQAGPIADIGVLQPLLFAVQIGLAASWRARGVAPAAVIGHSMGEAAAAVVSGSLSPADGVRVICRRSRLMRRLSGSGAMAAVPLGATAVTATIADAGLSDDVQVAVTSSPGSTVVSGSTPGIEALLATCADAGVDALRVDVDVASHSPMVGPILTEIRTELADVRPRRAAIPHFSTVGDRDPSTVQEMDAAYWADNLRRRVALQEAVRAAAADGHSVFVEISPHPVLVGAVGRTLQHAGVAEPAVLPTLHRDLPDPTAFALALARLHCLGHDIDWPDSAGDRERTDLPAREWDHSTVFWRPPAPAARRPEPGHPLLGARVRAADDPRRVLWTRRIDGETPRWLAEHRVHGAAVLPASATIDRVLGAALGAGLTDVVVRDLVLHAPVPVAAGVELQTICDLDGDGSGATVRLFHREGGAPWVQHTSGRVHREPAVHAALAHRTPADHAADAVAVDPASFYRELADHGLAIGEGLRRVRDLRILGNRAEIGLDVADEGDEPFAVDPRALDAALQAVAAVLPAQAGPGPVLITGFAAITLDPGAPPADRAVVELLDDGADTGTPTARAVLWSGRTAVGLVDGIRLSGTATRRGARRPPEVRSVCWVEEPRTGGSRPERWLLVGGPDALTGALRAADVDAVHVPAADPGRLAGLLRPAGFDRVVHLGAVDVKGDSPDDALALTEQVLDLLRVLDEHAGPRLHIATRHAVRTAPEDTASAAQAALWGLGRTIALERPDRWGGLLDLDDADAARWAEQLTAEWAGAENGAQACRRGRHRLVPRLRRAEPAPAGPGFDGAGAHLVVGGTGHLAAHLLDVLTAGGARCLVVASRSGGPPAWTPPEGTRVEPVAVDLGDRAAVRSLGDRFGADLPPLRTVHHAAFSRSVAALECLDEEAVRAMFRAKVHGLALLHDLAVEHGATEVVCLSSTTGLLGSAGLGHYAAASSYLDTFAGNRAVGPNPVRVVVLGPCAEGLAGTPDGDTVVRSGFRLMDGATAVTTAVRARAAGTPPVVVDADWDLLRLAMSTATASPLLEEDPAGGVTPLATLTTAAPWTLRDELRRIVADAMGVAEAAVRDQENLFSLGLDSLMSLTLVRRVRASLAHGLDPREIRDHPTVAALADHIARRGGPPAQPGPTTTEERTCPE